VVLDVRPEKRYAVVVYLSTRVPAVPSLTAESCHQTPVPLRLHCRRTPHLGSSSSCLQHNTVEPRTHVHRRESDRDNMQRKPQQENT
jgi:hypothetical protein